MTTYAKHRRVVRYIGSLTDMHGLAYVRSQQDDGRAVLVTSAGETLHGARPESFEAVATPAITEARMWGLRDLMDHGARAALPTRVRNWLVQAGLVEIAATEYDPQVRPRLTDLGYVVARAHRAR